MTTTTTRTKKTTTRKPAQSIEDKKAQAEALRASIDFAQAFHAYSINTLTSTSASEKTPPPFPVSGGRQDSDRQVRSSKWHRSARALDQKGGLLGRAPDP